MIKNISRDVDAVLFRFICKETRLYCKKNEKSIDGPTYG